MCVNTKSMVRALFAATLLFPTVGGDCDVEEFGDDLEDLLDDLDNLGDDDDDADFGDFLDHVF